MRELRVELTNTDTIEEKMKSYVREPERIRAMREWKPYDQKIWQYTRNSCQTYTDLDNERKTKRKKKTTK